MAGPESNTFPIINLSELTSVYKLYRIRGLDPHHTDYYANRGYVERRLSYHLKAPAVVIERDRVPYLVLPADPNIPEPPSPLVVVMGQVAFEREGNTFELDFTVRSPDTDPICLRFLQFAVQASLHERSDLWQPGSGLPFYEKTSRHSFSGIAAYQGFSVRAIVTPGGGIGLVVDVTRCYVGEQPLSARLTREEFFRRWRGRHFIYHYGYNWYEIQAEGISDFTVSELIVQKNGKSTTLQSYIMEESKKPLPPELANLSPEAAVIFYRDNRGQEKAAPAPLCYPVYGTDHPAVARHHNSSQLPPHVRRRLIHHYVKRYLCRLTFGPTVLRVDTRPLLIPSRIFPVPDFQFGNGTILSVRGTPQARHVALDQLGSRRFAMLLDPSVGFYEAERLYRQYLILPRSVRESYGSRFIEDLKRTVKDLYAVGEYDPIVVAYEDSVPHRFLPQARALLNTIEEQITEPGYAVVMLHPLEERAIRQEDQLAAFVIDQLRKRDVRAAIIHTEVPGCSYQLLNDGMRGPFYVPRDSEVKRLKGYLRNVALNKVLLTNRRLPFILATRLHADLVVGIDVKNNTAGLAAVDAYGGNFLTILRESKQKERLLEDQIKLYLMELIRKILQYIKYLPRHVVIHRDGRVYRSELAGIQRAIEALKKEGLLHTEASFTVVEISKSAPAPLRIFDVTERPEGGVWIDNPTIGTFFIVDSKNGYLCSTGRPLLGGVRGTVRPLHVRLVEGSLSLEACLEDIFYLSSLTWTKPEGCMRTPITTKLLDRFLLEEAGEYDEDQIEFGTVLDEEEVAS